MIRRPKWQRNNLSADTTGTSESTRRMSVSRPTAAEGCVADPGRSCQRIHASVSRVIVLFALIDTVRVQAANEFNDLQEQTGSLGRRIASACC